MVSAASTSSVERRTETDGVLAGASFEPMESEVQALYRVMKHLRAEVLGETVTAGEAVAWAVSYLPTGLGPAVEGPADRNA
ncbi:DUF6193 family natural product biosynthesis protein [Streptomyces sp. NPDC048558]|uniref:DUF6193 family natural product biosynthesis protein n=1 Tax=Streptomyces sp. NPDC048558 TaxID=3155759 RepID=UPI00344309E7